MAQIILGGLTTLNLATHLDPQFTELYALRNLFTISGSLLGFGMSPVAKFDVAGGGRFSGMSTVSSSVGAVSLGGNGSSSSVTFVNSGAAVDGKIWDLTSSGTEMNFRTINDAGGADYVWLKTTRSGLTVSAVQVGANFTPLSDNNRTLGAVGLRWSTVYAGTGTINTSDAREKTKVAPLSEAELQAAVLLSKEVGVFKFLSSVEQKEDAARIHCGMTVQRAIEIMEGCGLNAFDYAFICYDKWEAQDIPARIGQRDTGLRDSSGDPLMEEFVIEPARTEPAGDRYGFRPDQLALFIARGQAQRQDDLEARIKALEK